MGQQATEQRPICYETMTFYSQGEVWYFKLDILLFFSAKNKVFAAEECFVALQLKRGPIPPPLVCASGAQIHFVECRHQSHGKHERELLP